MTSQTIMWTALPNGIAEDSDLKISIFVSPRLQSEAEMARLGEFDYFQNWPQTLTTMLKEGLHFDLRVDGRFVESIQLLDFLGYHSLDPELWEALFKPDTLVRPYKFDDFSQNAIISYPAKVLHDSLKDLYAQFGLENKKDLASELDLPGLNRYDSIYPNLDYIWEIASRDYSAQGVAQDVIDLIKDEQLNGKGSAYYPISDCLQRFLLFHSPPEGEPLHLSKDNKHLFKTDGKDPFENYIDFHQAISSLGEYPQIMKKLGLVIDIEVDANRVREKMTSRSRSGSLNLVASGGFNSRTKTLSPKTAFILEGNRFEAASDPSRNEIWHRMLNLTPEKYELIQMDLDGAIFKLLSMILSVYGRNKNDISDPPKDISLASLRSSGISLVKKNRAIDTHSKFVKASENNSKIDRALLYAEDLVRGYRVDIFNAATGNWRSLCRRKGDCSIVGTDKSFQIDDEGLIQLALTTKATTPGTDPADSGDLYLNESILSWQGWSLCAPRPGKSIHPDSSHEPMESINDPVTPFKLSAHFSPWGLPSLRFGRSYRIRARAVDLAGSSFLIDEASDNKALPGITEQGFKYFRFEPVNAPVVVLTKMLSATERPGESTERLVIRSRNAGGNLDSEVTDDFSERHIVPPRISQLTAEVHGLFDSSNGTLKGNLATYRLIKDKDENGGEFKTVEDASVDPPVKVPVEPDERLRPLPYLPDPLSRGAAMRNLPGTGRHTLGRECGRRFPNGSEQFCRELSYYPLPATAKHYDSVTKIRFGSTDRWPEDKSFTLWPETRAFKLKLSEGSLAPHWDFSKRVLTVYLPKAEVATIPLSSYILPEDQDLMGMWNWIKEYADRYTIDLAELQQLSEEGGFWMLTPPRMLTLVHAVQQPLISPKIDWLKSSRQLGSNSTGLSGLVRVNGKSTSKVDLNAEWIESVDQLDQSGAWPSRRRCKSHVEEIPLRDLSGTEPLVSGNRSVGAYDPSSGYIVFKTEEWLGTVSVDEYVEYMGIERRDVNYWLLSIPIPNGFPLLGLSNMPSKAHPVHNLLDTKYREISYRATATSRFREYFEPDLDFSRDSNSIVVKVPSSARPESPHISYIMPAFGWTTSINGNAGGNTVTRKRAGGGLRIFMDMDGSWFSSGDGEMLGVVLLSDDQVPTCNWQREKLKPFITLWGMDPIRRSKSLSSYPGLINFPAERTARGLVLEEAKDLDISVDVAAYDVKYDKTKGLLYCDIKIDSVESYYPFIRLALARYQHNSLEDAHLSRVVLADFCQISPDRSVLITYDRDEPKARNVIVSGPSYKMPSPCPPRLPGYDEMPCNTIQISIEERDPNISGELGWKSLDNPIIETQKKRFIDEIYWKGRIILPSEEVGMFRLVVREFERLRVGGSAVGNRLVYADAIEL